MKDVKAAIETCQVVNDEQETIMNKPYQDTNMALFPSCTLPMCMFTISHLLKGCTTQSDGSLAIVDIDALKGFVNLWVHLTFAILLFSM